MSRQADVFKEAITYCTFEDGRIQGLNGGTAFVETEDDAPAVHVLGRMVKGKDMLAIGSVDLGHSSSIFFRGRYIGPFKLQTVAIVRVSEQLQGQPLKHRTMMTFLALAAEPRNQEMTEFVRKHIEQAFQTGVAT